MKSSSLTILVVLPLFAACNADSSKSVHETILVGTWECEQPGISIVIAKEDISASYITSSGNFTDHGALAFDNVKDTANIKWAPTNKRLHSTGFLTRSTAKGIGKAEIAITTNNDVIVCKNRH